MKKEIKDYLKKIGQKGGQSKSEKKAKAARENGRKHIKKIKGETIV